MTRILISLAIIMLPFTACAETKIIEYPDRLMVEVIGEAAQKEAPPAPAQQSAQAAEPQATVAENRRDAEAVKAQIAGRRAETQALRRAPEYESDYDRAERLKMISEKMNEVRRLETDSISDRVPGNGYTY